MVSLALKKLPSRKYPKPSSIRKKISAYKKEHRSVSGGLVQPQDKIVDRCALTIYPYSLRSGDDILFEL
jgi:hypothetical protein